MGRSFSQYYANNWGSLSVKAAANRTMLFILGYMAYHVAGAHHKISDLKKLSMEELMNVKVTLVTWQPKKLMETASAIQVITSEDIRHSTATRLPEALRLATNLQVAQTSSHGWAVSARVAKLSAAPSLETPEYFTLNAQLTWRLKNLTLRIAGMNWLDKRLKEFGRSEIPRNFYGAVTWRL